MSVLRNLFGKTFIFNSYSKVYSGIIKRYASDQDKFKAPSKKDLLRKTPVGKLEEIAGKHPYEEKEPLPEWKEGFNPNTGEQGGPKGPEPTRYGDWERKGRVSDF